MKETTRPDAATIDHPGKALETESPESSATVVSEMATTKKKEAYAGWEHKLRTY